MSDLHSRLARAIGIPATAARLLQTKNFDSTAEEFFLTHFPDLPGRDLLCWLAVPEPDEAKPKRPIKRIADRIVETWGRAGDVLALMEGPTLLQRVHDVDVRNEVLDSLRENIDKECWFQFALVATGGGIFTAIRDFERHLHEPGRSYPSGLLNEGPVPSLTTDLFPARRDDDACCKVLRSSLANEATRYYVVWLLRELQLLTRVGPPAVVLGDVPTLGEVNDPLHWHRVGFLVSVARNWPQRTAGHAWLTRRALDAAARGVSWYSLWWEFPPELRDGAAIESVATPTPAPWVARALAHRAHTKAQWEALLDFLDACTSSGPSVEDLNHGIGVSELALGRKPTHDEFTEFFQACDPKSWRMLIQRAPLPSDADDDFDARYIEFAERSRFFPDLIIERLSGLPLSASRACRIIKHALRSGSFWHLENRYELVRCMGSLEGVTIPVPPSMTADSIALFRTLAGDHADATLAERLADLIRGGLLHDALALADVAREIVSDDNRAVMNHLARSLPLSALAHLQASHPWFLTEADVLEEATRVDRERWGHVDSLPAYLSPIMEAKAVQTPVSMLAVALLDRLEANGVTRRKVLNLALKRLRTHGRGALDPHWLGRKLDTKSLWMEPGKDFVNEFLRDRDRNGAVMLLSVCLDAPVDHRPNLTYAMHAVIATCLVTFAEAALEAKKQGQAKNALTGLAHLNAPSRLRDRVRGLRRLDPQEDVLVLIEVNEGLLRRSDAGDAATIDAIRDALVALVGAEHGDAS